MKFGISKKLLLLIVVLSLTLIVVSALTQKSIANREELIEF